MGLGSGSKWTTRLTLVVSTDKVRRFRSTRLSVVEPLGHSEVYFSASGDNVVLLVNYPDENGD